MTLGVLAWPIRYIIFVIGEPSWLVIASLALHGFCYVFFFTAAYIYVDTIAPQGHPGLGPEPDRRRSSSASATSSAAFLRLDPEALHLATLDAAGEPSRSSTGGASSSSRRP